MEGYYPNELDKRWMRARPAYRGFSHDGILSINVDDYFDADVRIMFLLKEAPLGVYGRIKDGGMLIRGISVGSDARGNSGVFWKLLGMWTCVIDILQLGEEPDIEEFYRDHNDGGYGLFNAAYVNIKKGNGCAYSNWGDLKAYARRDRDFLNEQIDMLDPDVIVCCGTYQIYAGIVCDGDIPSGSQSEPVWDDVNERIVIDWHHPAIRGNADSDFWRFKEYCEQRSDLFEDI